MSVDVRTVLSSWAFNSGIGLAFLSIFSFLRVYKPTARFFSPKIHASSEVVPHKPPPLPPTFFSWLSPLWRVPEATVVETAGLDAAIFLRIVAFGLQLFFYLSVWCLVVILPLNVTGGQLAHLGRQGGRSGKNLDVHGPFFRPTAGDYLFSNFDLLSLANVAPGDKRLWVHMVSVYLVTVIVLRLLWRYNEEAVELRYKFLSSITPGGPTHTVLVTDIPGVSSGTLGDTIYQLLHHGGLRFLPQWLRDRLARAWQTSATMAVAGWETASEGVRRTGLMEGVGAGAAVVPEGQRRHNKPRSWQEWRRVHDLLQGGKSLETVVQSEFEAVYAPSLVCAVNVVYDNRPALALIRQCEEARVHLEDLLEDYHQQRKRRERRGGSRRKTGMLKRRQVRVVGPLYGRWGIERYGAGTTKVDALTFYRDWLCELKARINEEQERLEKVPVGSAFVTFNSRWTQVVAATALHCQDEAQWRIQAAPEVREVVWKNLHMRLWERQARALMCWAAVLVLMLFYIVPVSAVQALLQIDRLDQIPLVNRILAVPFVRSFVVGVLPGLALRLFVALLPSLLWWLNNHAGKVAVSEVEFAVVLQYYLFQIVTVFLASFITGTLTSQLNKIWEHPATILTVLGTGAPQTASFFILYIIFNAVVSKPLRLLNVWGLAVYCLRYGVAATERARRRLWEEQVVNFGSRGADHTITILLGLVFSLINPVVCLVCIMYFVIANLVERYELVYVYTRRYESGGKLWQYVFHQVMTGVYMFQLVMLGLLSIKRFPYTPLLLPLLFFTVFFQRSCISLFSRPWQVLSLRDARAIDRKDAGHPPEEGEVEAGQPPLSLSCSPEAQALYMSPVFKVDEEYHEELMAEVEGLRREEFTEGGSQTLGVVRVRSRESWLAGAAEDLLEPLTGGGRNDDARDHLVEEDVPQPLVGRGAEVLDQFYYGMHKPGGGSPSSGP